MSLTKLSSVEIGKISKLVEAKEELLQKIADLDVQIEGIAGGEAPASKPAAKTARKARKVKAAKKAGVAKAVKAPKAKKAAKAKGGPRGSHGALRDKIMAELEAAGGNGVRVKDLADKLGIKTANISVWFYTTGAKNKSIKKIAPATYALVQ